MSTDTTYRSFTPQLEIRAAGAGGDGRTVVGIAVPYGQPAYIWDEEINEQFAPGCAARQLAAAYRLPFAREHLSQGGTLIGRALELRDDPSGLWGAWKVSATPAGDETLELIRDGALRELSIGFREGQNRRLPDGTLERVTIDLREVAVVLRGAYGELAEIAAVRSAGTAAPPRPLLAEADQVLAGLNRLPVAAAV